MIRSEVTGTKNRQGSTGRKNKHHQYNKIHKQAEKQKIIGESEDVEKPESLYTTSKNINIQLL